MASLFSYPKTLHARRLAPGPFRDYRAYKPALRQEFCRRCVYCRLPDGMPRPMSFGVDHYIPRSHPTLGKQRETQYDNLFYACNACNGRKKNFWPTAAQVKAGVFVPNPCEHVMFKHLRYAGVEIHARTPAGAWTERLLALNDADSVKYRAALARTVECLQEDVHEYKRTLNEIDARLKSSPPSNRKAQLLRDRQAVEKELNTAMADLELYSGEKA